MRERESVEKRARLAARVLPFPPSSSRSASLVNAQGCSDTLLQANFTGHLSSFGGPVIRGPECRARGGGYPVLTFHAYEIWLRADLASRLFSLICKREAAAITDTNEIIASYSARSSPE